MADQPGRASPSDFRALFEAAPTPFLVLAPDLRIVAVNDAYLRATLTERAGILGRGVFEVFPDNPADPNATGTRNLRASLERVLATGRPDAMAVQRYDVSKPRAAGGGFEERWWSPVNTPVPGADGGVALVIHRVEDVTEVVRLRSAGEAQDQLARDQQAVIARLRDSEERLQQANETLEVRVAERTAALTQAVDALQAEARERAQAEDQLRQAQKMEAVGQLTGGIAHDFNNMLQAIGGSLDLLGRRVAQGRTDGVARLVEGARKTVSRAAALTHRLLAFARRQVLQPKPTNPDRLAEGMVELIRGTVGPGITVTLDLRDGTWPVLCDPHQLESVLLNLAINARDAMAQPSPGASTSEAGGRPEGGQLAIGTRNVRLSEADLAGEDAAAPGDYVEIVVADTGAGMDAATRARAFEPFFTTKPVGQGTGLGLSQLYGFVQQSNGLVRLDSALGQGTTVRLYLPRHEAARVPEQPPAPEAALGQTGAGRTVLLVEDEDDVRASAGEFLRDVGYTVLDAADGSTALRLLRSGVRPDVLVTDVGLPGGLNGRQVADAARERWPNLPVLFITGYAGSALDGQLSPGMDVVGKPMALDVLVARIEGLLRFAEQPTGQPA